MRFVDLFAGLGGFHLALKNLGHDCVFACEIDPELRSLYQQNFGLLPEGDIRSVDPAAVPDHDILCAGFPCQPFSKAGEQLGFDDPADGDLFHHVLAIAKQHRPKYVVLENVPNLEAHDGGKTWSLITKSIEKLGYDWKAIKLSPHQFGVPQIRKRIYVVAKRGDGTLRRFRPPSPITVESSLNIRQVLDSNPTDAKRLTEQAQDSLRVWQRFLDRYPESEDLPSFPIWSMEFGATYPFEDTTPWAMSSKDLARFRGAFGRPLAAYSWPEMVEKLPPYARSNARKFPAWKVDFIRKNRELYQRNRDWIDDWVHDVQRFPPSLQKLEWNCKGDVRSVWRHVLQFRASGIRVKKDTTAPSLVALTMSQVPIIGWERRFMTVRECARLQSMEGLKYLPAAEGAAFGALGNAVNVRVVEEVLAELFRDEEVGRYEVI